MGAADVQQCTVNQSIAEKAPEDVACSGLLVTEEGYHPALVLFDDFYLVIFCIQTIQKKVKNFVHIPGILCCQHIVFAKKYRII